MPSTYVDRIDGVTTSAAVKVPCTVVATTPITLSGVQTIDGVLLTAYSGPGLPADRVLVTAQADQTTNGIYLCQTGAWTREPDFDGARDAVTGTMVEIRSGTVNASTFWKLTCTDNPIVFGTSLLTFVQFTFFTAAATSSTSNTIGTGALTFTTQTGLNLQAGQFLQILDTASPTNYVIGTVTSYSKTTGVLVLNSTNTGGSGTYTTWSIFISGAVGPAPVISGTSASAQTPGTGAMTFATQASLAFAPGQFLSIISTAAPTAYMVGNITSYSGTSLGMNITAYGGSGSHTDWNISLSGPPSLSGAQLNAAQTFTGGQRTGITALTSSGGSIAVDFSLNNDFSHTFTENTTLANPTNQVAGQAGTIFLTQSSGGYSLAYGTHWNFTNGATPAVTTTNAALDSLYYKTRSSIMIEATLVKAWSS